MALPNGIELAQRALMAVLLVALAGCGATAPPGGDCTQDGRCPDGLACFPDFRCYALGASPACDPVCYGTTPFCDRSALRCVACLADRDCPAGTVCAPPIKRCQPGCSLGHPTCASAAETCDADLGVCHGCRADSDCTESAKAHCDEASGRCAPCVPDHDSCPPGEYCASESGSYSCVKGCASRSECGGATDGGVRSASADCCNHLCVDTASDGNHCGVCGFQCRSGRACCGGRCVDLSSDVDNCAACGNSCVAPNVTGASCTASRCNWTGCDQYFGDCDHNRANGCEANLSFDANDCNGCGNVCPAPPHGMPACNLLACGLGACLAGFADCDQRPGDGCEYDITGFATDGNNCGACRIVCAQNQTCVNGKCR